VVELAGEVALYNYRKFNHIKPLMRSDGFSLVELMVVIAIVAIVASVATPSFRSAFERKHGSEMTQSIGSMLMEAQMHATKTARDTYVCPVDIDNVKDDYSDIDCLAVDEWKKGLMVWQDSDNNGSFSFENDKIIKVSQSIDSDGLTVTFTKKGDATYPGYAANGLGVNNQPVGDFLLCDDSGNYKAKIVAGIGQPYTIEEGVTCAP